MYPYCLSVRNKVNLVQLSDGRFQLINDHPLEPFMIGYKYVLVEDALLTKLKSLPIEEVFYKKTIIWDRASGSELENYSILETSVKFDYEGLDKVPLEGLKFLNFDDRYLFVTPDLKNLFESTDIKCSFSYGFSEFG